MQDVFLELKNRILPPSIVLGVLLIAAGVFIRYVRIKRNYFLGYRTVRSMKNDTNWVFANNEMAKLSLVVGIVSTFAGILLWFLDIDKSKLLIYTTLGAIIVGVIIVEFRLYRFDKQNKTKKHN